MDKTRLLIYFLLALGACNLLCGQASDTSLVYYEEGLKAFKHKKYKLADSLFTLSANLTPHPDTYFNRAAVREKMGDKKGFCQDVLKATSFGDKEAGAVFGKECGVTDTFYVDAEGHHVTSAVYVHKLIVYKSKYEAGNLAVKYNNTGAYVTSMSYEDPADSARALVDEQAEFPGGIMAMTKYLKSTTKYPDEVIKNGLQGKVYVKFVVNRYGYIENIEIVKEIPDCKECSNEALRVVAAMPRWKPAKMDGKYVKSYYHLPIHFRMN